MARLFIFFVFLCFMSPVFAKNFTLNKEIKNGNSVPFLKFQGQGPWDNWLQMNLPFKPIDDLFHQVRIEEQVQLINRGEAHITVVTPVEYWDVLRLKNITMDEIDEIALQEKIQMSDFETLCLGEGRAQIDGRIERAFFVVVESKSLIHIREKIYDLFVSRGGNPLDFQPAHHYPHITVGFTERDLHESDGVIKDINSCVAYFD